MDKQQNLQADELDRLARKRASAKMGWYIHAIVYIAVNLMMAALSAMSERHWAVFPALGWGLGLAIHGAVVFLVTGGGGLHERMVRQERQRLNLQRDPW
jgi:hypothetical protein